ncbi:hypothetical protein HAX54_014507, partial [Datura stramonium]|nr:hypothetical protein [Datura stramonium]
ARSVRELGHRDNPIVIEAESVRETGHRDDPIVIEDDEEVEHENAQQGVIFYDGDLSYEALLSLQERIGNVETGLQKKSISELLKQRKYQLIKMNNCSNSCSICLDTYGDGEELEKINCDHEFHYHFISNWLKIKNSSPICKRTALIVIFDSHFDKSISQVPFSIMYSLVSW